VHPEFQAQPQDEILEQIWCRREDGDATLSGLLDSAQEENAGELVNTLERQQLLRLVDDHVELTTAGEERARTIIRGHRLAKRLLFDVLDLPAEETEKTACLMEHVLGPAAADAVCSFLGHPPRCPEGRDIPAGLCCKERDERQLRPLVVPLHEMKRGRSGRIVFMTPRYQKRFDRLGLFGVVPGSTIRLRQTQPSVVIEIEGTSLALDRDVAREIYVRRES
jgi:DtxR family Mn-dependent transcriptional regulator